MGNKNFSKLFFLVSFLAISFFAIAQDVPVNSETSLISNSVEIQNLEIEPVVVTESPVVAVEPPRTSAEYVRLCWEASGRGEMAGLAQLIVEILKDYGTSASVQQSELTDFPSKGEEKEYASLNDVATCLFVQAEALMNRGQSEEAKGKFKNIIENYSWARAWDPRGWFWSIAEKSQASIDVMEGRIPETKEVRLEDITWTKPVRIAVGTEENVDYTKYGEFLNVGTENYHYRIANLEGLKKATGEGIYPNLDQVFANPRFKTLRDEGKFLEDDYWKYVNTTDLEIAYFKWARAKEPWGVRLFYLGVIFEKAEMFDEALKAYHALVVHFPRTVAMTNWKTPWYPAQAAIAKIQHILRVHPELGLEAKWMKIEVKNGFDNDTKNDIFFIWPGKIVEKGFIGKVKESLGYKESSPLGKIEQTVGAGRVQLVQYENGHWQMLVDSKPFMMKGITYEPTKIGQSPDKGTLANWMEEDTNNNGLIDGPFDSWVDTNKNNEQDADESVVGDFQLMKEMGANVLRMYHSPREPKKEVLRKLYNDYGIMVVMGDFLGKYAIGSGATWGEGTNYENPEHQAKMMEAVRKMVMEHKDEPYLLLWVLGNENNYGVACNADSKPEAYFKFADQVALMIKSIDPNHPVALNNGDTLYLDLFAKNAPNVDIFAANVYRGDYGFGSFWEQVYNASGKPAFISEYGSPAYAPYLTFEQGDQAQADYHLGNWMDIETNTVGQGVGNSIGGIAFEWLDEWWKNYEPFMHDVQSDAIGPFAGGYYFEEWFGIISQGNGRHSPFMRQPRKAYYLYKQLWNK